MKWNQSEMKSDPYVCMKNMHNPKAADILSVAFILCNYKTRFFRTFVKLMNSRMLIFYCTVDIFPFFIVFFFLHRLWENKKVT